VIKGRFHRARVLTGWLLVASVFVGAAGYLPSGAIIRRIWATSERYPCESNACGCSSAHECWTACCCSSPAEHIAWALEHGVEVPDYAVVSDRDWAEGGSLAAASSEGPSVHSCCATPVNTASCCTLHEVPASPHAKASLFPRRTLTPLGCKGVQTNLTAVPPGMLLASRPPMPRAVFVGAARVRPVAPESLGIEAPVPPPRALA
jgi:hypothetical protein